jgi:hypothetical protein
VVEERWEPATRRLLFGLGLDREPSGAEIGVVKALIDQGCTDQDLQAAVNRLALDIATGRVDTAAFRMSVIVGPAFQARNERRGLDICEEPNKDRDAHLRLTGTEYDRRPNRSRGPGPVD